MVLILQVFSRPDKYQPHFPQKGPTTFTHNLLIHLFAAGGAATTTRGPAIAARSSRAITTDGGSMSAGMAGPSHSGNLRKYILITLSHAESRKVSSEMCPSVVLTFITIPLFPGTLGVSGGLSP